MGHDIDPLLRAGLRGERREWLRFWWPWVLLAAAIFAVCWLFVKPAPPHRVVILAGPRDGSYFYFANKYAKTFAANGVELDVRETAGAVENYRLLQEDPSASLAIVQGGAAPADLHVDVNAIASLYLEPVWLFYRGQPGLSVQDLQGKRIAIGPPGSGSRAIAIRILAASGVVPQELDEGDATTRRSARLASTGPTTAAAAPMAQLSPLANHAAAQALKDGDVDALIFVMSPNNPMVADLLASEGVQLMSFQRHEAYARIYPFLSSVRLVRGVVDLRRDLPHEDIDLVAPAANLVCRAGLHPALVPLTAKAATLAHEHGDRVTAPGKFPNIDYVEFPVDPGAREYFKSGPPFLQRYLPFWVAAWVDRTKILLLPLLTLIIPLTRVAPPLYRWRIRRRVYRWYKLLHDSARRTADGAGDANDELALLRTLDDELSRVRVPLSYMQELYQLRSHVGEVRAHLEGRVAEAKREDGELVR